MKDMISKSITNDCLFWNVSNEVLVMFEGDSYRIPNDEPSAKKSDAHTWAHVLLLSFLTYIGQI